MNPSHVDSSAPPADGNDNEARFQAAQRWSEQCLGTALRVSPIAADASARRYFRLHSVAVPERSYILMDAPAQGASTAAFVRIAAMMRSVEIPVPEILAADYRNGFLLLSDLGQQTYLQALAEQPPEPLFVSAIDALLRWQAASRPARLPEFSAHLLRAELELFPQWYLRHHCQLPLSSALQRDLERLFTRLIEALEQQPRTYVHRDYMPRNLLVGDPLPGVLDFQDAVRGPLTYDPICLFRDAFISWPRDFVRAGLREYWQRGRHIGLPLPDDFEHFWQLCQWTGLQRHIKVIGIFARLRYRDQKPRYASDINRFFGYIQSAGEELRLTALLAPVLRHAMPQTAEDAASAAEKGPCAP
ncbi:phosphotransferase [Halorhodospira abdelmalekii]|uniref:phosphotransferase n=1 Tax=Halorhodospira abdelmalekii TaxID=421629 RepID=UPI001908F68E